ncbi:transposase [Paracoccus yeei]|uniref:transposase n=1 Tax=Paracoccus yeei TaxID=147645 RepID=UPI003B8A647D
MCARSTRPRPPRRPPASWRYSRKSGPGNTVHRPAWRRAWAEVTPFYAFSAAIRKIIYTTNAVESLNRVLRKTLKTKGSFPTEEAATKLIFLAIRNFEKGGRAVREWVAARNQLAIMFAGRFDA